MNKLKTSIKTEDSETKNREVKQDYCGEFLLVVGIVIGSLITGIILLYEIYQNPLLFILLVILYLSLLIVNKFTNIFNFYLLN